MAASSMSVKRASANERAAEYEMAHQPHLFQTPSDLLCPLTHDLFVDPVINTAGQVYERHAIERHLSYSDIDPIARTVLTSKQLTPVYILRSRAIEYREISARACIDAACSSLCEEPVRYLRRAAELCSVLPSPVQGLSKDCIAYVQTHTSNAYNERILRLFARGLYSAGYRDKAASVYYSLLQSGVDRAQQAELLQLCLKCWTGGAKGENPEADPRVFAKLANFVSTQRTFTWAQIIDIVQLAELGDAFTLRLCEQLLSSDTCADADQEGEKSGILLKYVQVSCSRLQERVHALEQHTGAAAGEASNALPKSGRQPHGSGKPGWLNNRAVASAALLLTTVANAQGPLFQAAKIASLLCLIRKDD